MCLRKVQNMMEYDKMRHQVAGHDGAMEDSSGSLFIKPTTQQEVDFYQQIQRNSDGAYADLMDWMPAFIGVLEKGITEGALTSGKVTDEMKELDAKQLKEGDSKYIVLQNLLYGFKNPSVIDIKLGSLLHDDNTTDEKIKRLEKVREATTSGSLSYRVCGFKLYGQNLPDLRDFHDDSLKQITKDDEGYISFNKWFGRALTTDNIEDCFKLFFTHNNLAEKQKQIIIRNTFTRLQLLYNCLLDTEIQIRSGSLLLVFENDLEAWDNLNNDDPIYKDDLPIEDVESEDDEGEEEGEGDEYRQKRVRAPLSLLSLIDFAHAKVTHGKIDENIIKGVENLLNTIEPLIEEE